MSASDTKDSKTAPKEGPGAENNNSINAPENSDGSIFDSTHFRGGVLFLAVVTIVALPVILVRTVGDDDDDNGNGIVEEFPEPSDPSCFILERTLESWEWHHNNAIEVSCELASIIAEEENQAVIKLLEKSNITNEQASDAELQYNSVWIGGRLIGQIGNRGPEHWEWSDGKVYSYENWHFDEPNNFWEEFYQEGLANGDDLENRLTMRYSNRQYGWNDLPEAFDLPAVYKCIVVSNGSNNTQNQDIFYTYKWELNGFLGNWSTHNAIAKERNCEMASILDKNQNDQVISLIDNSELTRSSDIWLGGQLYGRPASKGADNWQWSDGTVWSFEGWLLGEPNDFWQSDEDRITYRFSRDNETWAWNDLLGTVDLFAVYKCC